MPARLRRFALTTALLSGFSALIYEVVWSRELAVVFGSTVYAVSLMLGAFMGGLSVGSLVGGRWTDRSPNRLALLARLELSIGAVGLASLPGLELVGPMYVRLFGFLTPGLGWYLVLQAVLSIVVMLAPTFLMGAVFPIFAKLCAESYQRLGRDVGVVYSVNTLGAIAGSLTAGFLFIPLWGIRVTVVIAAAANVAIGFVLLSAARAPGRRRTAIAAASLITLLLAIVLFADPPAYAVGFYNLHTAVSASTMRQLRGADLVTVFCRDSAYGRVGVFRDPMGGLFLQHSGAVEGSTGEGDVLTNGLLAILPAATFGSPRSVLVVGLGTGYTSHAALRGSATEVVTVEIDPVMVEASRYFVGSSLSDDPRWSLVIDDARGYLAASERRFDVITAQPSYPVVASVSPLFTLEYFQIVAEHLSDGGVFCEWLPRYAMEAEDYMMMYKTFARVFPNVYVWATVNPSARYVEDILMVGCNRGFARSPSEIEQAVRGTIQEQGFELMQMDFAVLETPETVNRALSDPSVPLNTDDRPLLEYRAVHNWVSGVWTIPKRGKPASK